MASKEKDSLCTIVERQLSSVEFIRDYIQLKFDGPYLTCYAFPEVFFDKHILKIGNEGYRDKLCELIGHNVIYVDVKILDLLEIIFDNNVVLKIYLNEKDYRAAETVIFTNSTIWWVL